MQNWRESRYLKITTLILVFTFLPAQTSWAIRGRRGGGGTSTAIISAIGGAALPLTSFIAGPNATYAMFAGSTTALVMSKAGVDPQVTTLVSAAVSGVVGGGLEGGFAAISAGKIGDATLIMVKSVVKRVVAAEINYELSKAGLGYLGGLAGGLAGIAIEGGFSLGFGQEAEYISGVSWGESLPRNFSTFTQSLPSQLFSTLLREGVAGLIEFALQEALDERDPALRYVGNISNLASATVGLIEREIALGNVKVYEVDDAKTKEGGQWRYAGVATPDEVSKLKFEGDHTEYQPEQVKEEVFIAKYVRKSDGQVDKYTLTRSMPVKEWKSLVEQGYKWQVVLNKDKQGEIRFLRQIPGRYGGGTHFAHQPIDAEGHHFWDTWKPSWKQTWESKIDEQKQDFRRHWSEPEWGKVYYFDGEKGEPARTPGVEQFKPEVPREQRIAPPIQRQNLPVGFSMEKTSVGIAQVFTGNQ